MTSPPFGLEGCANEHTFGSLVMMGFAESPLQRLELVR